MWYIFRNGGIGGVVVWFFRIICVFRILYYLRRDCFWGIMVNMMIGFLFYRVYIWWKIRYERELLERRKFVIFNDLIIILISVRSKKGSTI